MRKCKYHPFIDDWITKVERGKVHSCKEMKQLMPVIRAVLDDHNVEIRAEEIEDCVKFSEEYFFELYDAEKFIVGLIVGLFYRDTGLLVFNQIFIMAGRGFGKNGLISAISAWMISKQNIKKYNVDIVATSEEQAETSFMDVHEMITELPESKKRLWSYNLERIAYKATNAKMRYRTSNAKTKDGGRPGCVIFDEIHAYENYENIKVFTGGLGKVSRPRRIYITTDGEVRDGLLDDYKERARQILSGEQKHKGFLPIIFKLDTLQEVGKPELWDKANPRINLSLDLKAQIESEYDEMLSNEKLKEAFITKRMNIPYVSKAITVASWEDIMATKDNPVIYQPGIQCQGSLDFADLMDFASAGIRWKDDGKTYFIQHTWIHEKSLQLTKYNIDIDEAVEKGWATIIREREYPTIPAVIIAEWFTEKAKTYNLKKKIKCDLFRISMIADTFRDAGWELDPVRNGDATHNKVAPLIQGLFAERKLVLEDDKLMRWFIWNVKVSTSSRGNKVFEKIEPIKRKTDGFFCLLHGLVDDDLKERQKTTYFYDVRTY